MATGIGSLSVQITGSATGLSASLKDAESQLKGFQKNAKAAAGGGGSKNEFAGFNLKIGETLKSEIGMGQIAMGNLIASAVEFGATLARSAASAMADIVQQSVKLGAEMESTKVSFEVLLGDKGKADGLYNELRDLAKKTPLSQSGVNDAAKVLLGSGEKQSNVAPMINMLGNFASDKASVKDLAILMGQVKGKGQLYAEEAQQFAEKNIMVYSLLGKTFNKTDAEMRQMVADGKVSAPMLTRALHEATLPGGQFAGMMEKQGGTFNGLKSTLIDTFEQAGAQFGEILIQELDLKGLMKDITALFDGGGNDNALREFVRAFKPLVGEMVGVAKGMLEASTWLMKFITPAVKFAADLMIAVDKFGDAVAQWFGGDGGPEDTTGRGDFSGAGGRGGFIDTPGLDYGKEQLNAKQLEHAKAIGQQYDPIGAMKEQADELRKMKELGAFDGKMDQFAFAMGKVFEPTLRSYEEMQSKMGVNAAKGSIEAASIITASMQRGERGNLAERALAAQEHARFAQEQSRDYLRQIADVIGEQGLLGVK